MAAKLLYRDAQGRDASVDLLPEGAFLGRAIDCVVRTDDAMVSRKNCKVSLLGGRWYVEDLGSANGTYISTNGNERRIQKECVNHGDVIRCGTLQVRFVEVADLPGGGAIPGPGPGTPKPPRVPGNANENTNNIPVEKADELLAAPPPHTDRPTGANAVPPTAAATSATGNQQAAKKEEDLRKAIEERDQALAAAKEAKEALAENSPKLEAAELEVKRLRGEAIAQRDSLEAQKRQVADVGVKLREEEKVNDQLRQESRDLKAELEKARALAKDLKDQVDGKDRQLSMANDEVRRAKQNADSLSAKLQEAQKARDEQLRAGNSNLNELERLREVLKEKDRMLEDRRVGLANLESQVKDLRLRAEALEKELTQTRGERDNLKERQGKNQAQQDELRQEIERQRGEIGRLGEALSSQQAGGEHLVQLGRENDELREELRKAHADLGNMQESAAQAEKLRAQVNQLGEDKKAAGARLQQTVDQAVRQAVEQAKAQFDARLSAEQQRLTEAIKARDEAIKARDEAMVTTLHDATGPGEDRSAELSAALLDNEGLKKRIEELQAQARAAAPSASTDKGAQGGESRALEEIRAVVNSAYDALSQALSELRVSVAQTQEAYTKMQGSITDREAARKVRDAIEATVDRVEDFRAHVRDLSNIIN